MQFVNTLGKGMNPAILPSAMGEIVGQTVLFTLSIVTSSEKKNFEYKPAFLKIYIVSHP